jgi:MYXO-CTERM domain-containing protein
MFHARRNGFPALVASVGVLLAALAGADRAMSQEPAACLSSDPSVWPKPSRPYFMLAIDTSGSMTTPVQDANGNLIPTSCGFGTDRIAHSRCAMRNTILAYSGEVNFGLATFAAAQSGCSAACYANCQYFCYQAEINTAGTCAGCGPEINGNPVTRAGAFIQVPMLQDHFWSNPPDATNVPALLNWVDNQCGDSKELFAAGNTPLNGMLRDMKRYFGMSWTAPDNSVTYTTPLASQDLSGAGVNGSTGCRTVNVILQTDGDETCDTQQDAVNAAADLYQNGVTVGGKTFKIRTYVINFAGGNQANTDAIANAGGTGASYFATNEVQLSQALAAILASSVSPETCDNKDNNCNGCTDEGFAHYCDVGQTCCAWGTAAQRTACLSAYTATITPANPNGDLTKLPCTTVTQQTQPANWLCYNPGESCDNVDNNCNSQVDEGVTKCGNPLHCPQPETCNGKDDNCNGIVDDGNVCSGCTPTPEVCDGCDNDCDGIADNGISSVPCGQASPANCAGVITCSPKPVGTPGACTQNTWSACSNSPQTETCDGVDNNCNGIVDDGVAPTQCVPAGTPPGLVYGGTSQCVKGLQACGSNSCVGFVGPSTEVCDGIDNNCNGQVDDNAFGVGQPCGINQGICKPGVTACVGGQLICQGSIGPQPEVCDGIDNNCNGQIDESPLSDGPAAGQNGCWTNAGNCCTFHNLSWCPPAGATCSGDGTLTAPCNPGTLVCQNGAWTCQNPKGPSAEVCDGLDNNCNGQTDENLSGQPCGINVGVCKAGTLQCTNGVSTCVGSVGPSAEVCDGLDNDCDGQVDDNIPGLGAACGNNTPPCKAGVTACVGGQIICQGAILPQSEICNGIDDNCNGQIDEGNLADAPPAGQNGCWLNPGNCCTFHNLSWCPPAGASCNADGALTPPCAPGTLACVAGAWACQNPKGPGPEVCDGADNNCNGLVDDVTPQACIPAGQPPNLVFGGNSQCKMGQKTCGACVGFVGPSAELCDGIDNNCNGQTDENAFGVGQACGVNQPPCSPGLTACVNGALVCQGGKQPSPEVCNGIDDNCNGVPDDPPLADGPPPGQNGCWNDPPNCANVCSFANLQWCPPPGATCNGNGSLSVPCNHGSLACAGAAGWVCQNPKDPAAETCDGLDNDCNGSVDDGNLPGVGGVCGSNVGECKPGVIVCANGVLDCAGDVPPSPEICDGLDNDCDGQIDNGIPLGGTCTPAYDAKLYPGDRTSPPCQPGVLQCNGAGGLTCVGGVGPNPEVCDGIDNDCDGQVDEVGAAPDGINGSDNPLPPPNAKIGDTCGMGVGVCVAGVWACQNGQFQCQGSQNPQPEECDCKDNDCNGKVDDGSICSGDKQCVKGANGCQCASPCGNGEQPCPPGQKCESVTSSETGMTLGGFCVVDYDALCGDCTTKTIKDAKGNVVCAPAGTVLPGCIKPPVCACKGPAGCDDPCSGVTCGMGQACAPSGPNAGKCVIDNCFNVPCQGCDKACNLGSCVDDPCKDVTCPPDKECVPSPDFKTSMCVGSCATVTCKSGEVCKQGMCVPTCDPACPNGQVCDEGQMPPACVADKCMPNPCSDGSCCDPVTGACGNCPCEGVVCPKDQVCKNGSCFEGMGGTGGTGGSTGTGTGGNAGTGGSTGTAGNGGGTGTTSGTTTSGIWGLATGGGGCACNLAGDDDGPLSRVALAALALAAAGLRRRKRRTEGATERRSSSNEEVGS